MAWPQLNRPRLASNSRHETMQQMVRYNCDWDPEKAKDNLAKHKVGFESAATVFLDPRAVTVFDEDHSGGEGRWITMGFDRSGVLLVVNSHVPECRRVDVCGPRDLGPQGHKG